MEDFIQNRFGYCFYDTQRIPALIYNLYVNPEHRRQGRAKRLLEVVIHEIRAAGYKGVIAIEAVPKEGVISLEKLRSFYEKMGLKII